MTTIAAIYEAGVFKPLEKVDLPEAAQVELAVSEAPAAAEVRPELAAVREALSFRYEGGRDDAAQVDPARK